MKIQQTELDLGLHSFDRVNWITTDVVVPSDAVFIKAAFLPGTMGLWFRTSGARIHRRVIQIVRTDFEFAGAGWDYIDSLPFGSPTLETFHVFDGGVVG
jgi:hypothetical protein